MELIEIFKVHGIDYSGKLIPSYIHITGANNELLIAVMWFRS